MICCPKLLAMPITMVVHARYASRLRSCVGRDAASPANSRYATSVAGTAARSGSSPNHSATMIRNDRNDPVPISGARSSGTNSAVVDTVTTATIRPLRRAVGQRSHASATTTHADTSMPSVKAAAFAQSRRSSCSATMNTCAATAP